MSTPCDAIRSSYAEKASSLEQEENFVREKQPKLEEKKASVAEKQRIIQGYPQKLYTIEEQIKSLNEKRSAVQSKIDKEEDIDKKFALIDKKEAITKKIEAKKNLRSNMKAERDYHKEELAKIEERIRDLSFQIQTAKGRIINVRNEMSSLVRRFENADCEGSILQRW